MSTAISGHLHNRRADDMTPDLIATCGTCKEAVAAGEGSLWINHGAVYERNTAAANWDENRAAAMAAGSTDAEVSSAEELWSNRPDLPSWRVDHYACERMAHIGAYSIEVSRVDSWQKLCWWAGQLGDKSWITSTDWPMLIQGAANGTDDRLKSATGQSVGRV